MQALFQGHSDALTHTVEIADRCNLELRFDEKHIPGFRFRRVNPSTAPWTSSHERGWTTPACLSEKKKIGEREARYRARLKRN